MGLEALDGVLTGATDALLKRKNKRRLIIDLGSTEDPAHGKQDGVNPFCLQGVEKGSSGGKKC